MLPLFLDLKGKRVVVFGGGEVGLRKAKYFQGEAEVTAVSKEFVPQFRVEGIRIIKADIQEVLEAQVNCADFVIAATDDKDLNDRIQEEATAQGRFCNRADETSTFLIPSLVKKEGFSVAISTEGRSPGMSKFIRLKLEKELDGRYSQMVKLQCELREEAKNLIPHQKKREEILWQILNDQTIWDYLSRDYQKAKEMALKKLGGQA